MDTGDGKWFPVPGRAQRRRIARRVGKVKPQRSRLRRKARKARTGGVK
ncbi:Uncharacterised protein [Mycobacteroides abscessus subsp. abscessus]|nr:Uncharacterised protein [Mycobacteroides abscessus subsp. abscessus]